MRAFYSDHFVLPLPDGHTFPMPEYARLRERLVGDRVLPPGALSEAPVAPVAPGAPAAPSPVAPEAP